MGVRTKQDSVTFELRVPAAELAEWRERAAGLAVSVAELIRQRMRPETAPAAPTSTRAQQAVDAAMTESDDDAPRQSQQPKRQTRPAASERSVGGGKGRLPLPPRGGYSGRADLSRLDVPERDATGHRTT